MPKWAPTMSTSVDRRDLDWCRVAVEALWAAAVLRLSVGFLVCGNPMPDPQFRLANHDSWRGCNAWRCPCACVVLSLAKKNDRRGRFPLANAKQALKRLSETPADTPARQTLPSSVKPLGIPN